MNSRATKLRPHAPLPEDKKMYLPENNAQMFDILSELRLYAAMNALPKLAEMIDDSLVLLVAEGKSFPAGTVAHLNQDTR